MVGEVRVYHAGFLDQGRDLQPRLVSVRPSPSLTRTSSANLVRATFMNANLTDAYLARAKLVAVNFRGARGLDPAVIAYYQPWRFGSCMFVESTGK
ncbi:MAG: hypothetical protein JWQ95_6616 [Sphaerisporangium sp.]|nr:hypothetical protein [Sphaerisporangium sp.]